LRATKGRLAGLDRLMYLTAAMTGMRQGELVALRWRDVDWIARRIRVRQSHVRGEFGTPKSKRSSRSVPLADQLAGELERYFQTSDWQEDDDLVFGNPATGKQLGRSRLIARFKEARDRAKLREVRFPRASARPNTWTALSLRSNLRSILSKTQMTSQNLRGLDRAGQT
jgi:integrase